MRNFVRMFQTRFADAVENGEKCQTIRATPKRMPKAGDTISCRSWIDKPYRSKQRVLCEGRITEVCNIEISELGIKLNGKELDCSTAELLAVKDGFVNAKAMTEWFYAHYDMPFEGVLISWEGCN